MMAAGADLRKIFAQWLDSDLKVQVVAFYHNNPGVLETVEGLSRRLGIPIDVLRKEVASQVSLGFLRERRVGSKKILLFDRDQEKHIRQYISDELRRRRLQEAG